ncbi:MAG: hypothetical protein OIF57_14175 [Marinobacterium sp.]|nr:hypothetical protein [Marinobacterium sp.]
MRSITLLKKKLNQEVEQLDAGLQRGSGLESDLQSSDVQSLFELLRSEGKELERLVDERRQNESFNLAELSELCRCYICEEPVPASQWHDDPSKIRCPVCVDD